MKKSILQALMNYEELSRTRAVELMEGFIEGKFSPEEMASILTAFNMRGIQTEELKGFRDVLLERCHKIDLGHGELIDVCGTGGDSKNTINISTLTAFVIAGAGFPVAKHGNFGVTSVSGSSTVLQTLGVNFTQNVDLLKRQLSEANICFLHAPLFHPALGRVAPVRSALKVRTFFNILGPLINPARPAFQFNGVTHPEVARTYHYLLESENIRHVVYFSLDGHDEITLTSDFKYSGTESEGILSPADLGFDYVKPASLSAGETKEHSAVIFSDILTGKGTREQNEVIVANAALAISFFKKTDISQARRMAEDSLAGGKAYACFQKLKKLSHE